MSINFKSNSCSLTTTMDSNLVKHSGNVYKVIEIGLSLSESMQNVNTGISGGNLTSQYGFVIAGYCPCYVESVAESSIAERNGLRKGDLIMKVNETNCCRARIKSVLTLVKSVNASSTLRLTVYRPVRVANTSKSTEAIGQTHKNITNVNLKCQQSNKSKLFAKLLKPSLWLSCAQQTFNQSIMTTVPTKQPTSRSSFMVDPSDCSSKLMVNGKMTMTTGKSGSSTSSGDTGYETLSRYEWDTKTNHNDQQSNDQELVDDAESHDFTIQTVTNTINSYSDCDLTVEEPNNKHPVASSSSSCNQHQQFKLDNYNEMRTKLIGDLIEIEANFVNYLNIAVSTFSRPLRGFFMKQQDYFCLFQNIEKILVISENFLRSMDKWSAYDLYTKIGQLYMQKISLFKDAYTIYVRGYGKSKALLDELKSHSKQFRLFLNEVESSSLTLENFLDLPLVHIHKTLNIFKEIRNYTCESRRNPTEAPHIDSIIFELRKILANLNESKLKLDFNLNKKLNYEQIDTADRTATVETTVDLDEFVEDDCDDCHNHRHGDDDDDLSLQTDDSVTLFMQSCASTISSIDVADENFSHSKLSTTLTRHDNKLSYFNSCSESCSLSSHSNSSSSLLSSI